MHANILTILSDVLPEYAISCIHKSSPVLKFLVPPESYHTMLISGKPISENFMFFPKLLPASIYTLNYKH